MKNQSLNNSLEDDCIFTDLSNKSTPSKPIDSSIRTLNTDSAYSSFISSKTSFLMKSSSPISIINATAGSNSNKPDSTGTSWSSRADEEMEELFVNVQDTPVIFETASNRRSLRNSPWSCRPESAPLHEEDEDDSDREPQFDISLRDDEPKPTPTSSATTTTERKMFSTLPCCLRSNCSDGDILCHSTLPEFFKVSQDKRPHRLSITEDDIRNEMIAIHLRALAEKVPGPPHNDRRNRNERLRRHSSSVFMSSSVTTSTSYPSSSTSFSWNTTLGKHSNSTSTLHRNNSFSSFSMSEILPSPLSVAVSILVPLYRVFKHRSDNNNNSMPKSFSSLEFSNNSHQTNCPHNKRMYFRNRSKTE